MIWILRIKVNMAGITINHIAIVVEDIEGALPFWRDALGLPFDKTQDVPQEQVKIAFLEVGDSHVELVQPITDDSGIAKYLAKKGAGMHHLCFEVDDIWTALAHMQANGIELINDTPKERDGRKYAFVHPKSTGGVLVELYERL
jgi:methylmalonyl-CoA/ethylmalonyl-CoA epimerase